MQLRFFADDWIKQIFVNGHPLLTANVNLALFRAANGGTVALGEHWVPGQRNVLIVQTLNLTAPAGFLVQAQGSALCSSAVNVVKSTTQTTAVTAGQTNVPFSITVSNYSSSEQTVKISDPLPTGIVAPYTWSCTAANSGIPITTNSPGQTACPTPASNTLPAATHVRQTGPLELPSFKMGAQSTIRFDLYATIDTAPPPVITNKVTVTPSNPAMCVDAAGVNRCTSTASVSTGAYASIAKTVKKPAYFAGDTVEYDVTLSNAGSVQLTNVSIQDTMPSQLSNPSWTCAPPISSNADCPKVGANIVTSGLFNAAGELTNSSGTVVLPVTLNSQDSLVFTVKGTAPNPVTSTISATNVAKIATALPNTAQCWKQDPVTNTYSVQPLSACSASATILPPTPITLTKTASPASGSTVYPGGAITYTVTVTNGGTVASKGTLADTPNGVTLTPVSCTMVAGGTTSTPAACLGTHTLPAGAVLTYTATTTVGAPATPPTAQVTNQATWTPDAAELANTTCNSVQGAPCSASVNHTVSVNPVISVAANVAPSSNVLPGSTVNYTLIFSNTGTVNAPNVEVHAPVNTLSGVTINSAWTCDAAASLPSTPASICDDFVATTLPAPPPAGTLSGSFGSLPVGAKVVFKATGLVDAMLAQGASVTLTASDTTTAKVHTCDPASRTNTTNSACEADATFTVSTPVLGITHTALPNTNLPPGASTVYTIRVTNPGVFIVTDAQVLAGPALAPNAAYVTPTSVTCAVTDPTPAPGVASTCPTGLAVSGQTITSNADGLFNPGAQYLITVNANVSATAPFSSSIDLPATIGSGSLGPLMTCNPGSKSGSTCEAVANIALSGPPVLSVSNSVNSAVAAPNAEVLYTIIAKNESGSPIADGVLITDPASIPNITLGDWVCVHSNTTLACPVPNGSGPLNQGAIALAVGESLTYTVKGKIAAAAPDGAVIDVDAKFTSAATGATCQNSLDGTPVPCRQRATVTVNYAPPVLSITNVVAPTTAAPDDEVTFTIVAKNTLGKPLTDGVITTDSPANITLGAWTCVAAGGATCPAASGTGAINAAAANIPMNGTLTYAIKGKIATGTADNTAITLNASITSATAGVTCAGTPTSLPCKAPATVTVKLKPSVLSLTHTAIPDTVAPGGKSTFTIVATNNSGQAITDGVLTTDSPANLSLGTWTCTASGGAMCPKAGAVTKASGPLNLTALNLPVGGSLTFTAEGTLGTTLKDGDSVTLMANLNSATAGTTCLGGTALPCVAPATVNIKVAAVVSPAPIPVDARWMLIALSVLLALAAAAHQQRARKGMRQ